MFSTNRQPSEQIIQIGQWILSQAQGAFPERFAVPSTHKEERRLKFEAIAPFFTVALFHLRNNPDLAQQVHDYMFDLFDIALREQGVADVRVGPEVKKLASAFYGRMAGYEEVLETGASKQLKDILSRNHVCAPEQEDAVCAAFLGAHAQLQTKAPSYFVR